MLDNSYIAFLQQSPWESEADNQAGVRKLSECEAVLPSPGDTVEKLLIDLDTWDNCVKLSPPGIYAYDGTTSALPEHLVLWFLPWRVCLSGSFAKRLETPWVHNPDATALTRRCERSEAWIFPGEKLTHKVRPRRGKLHGCVVTAQISLNYNGLDAVFQRMRKMQKIATPLSRLAMTIKWDSSELHPFFTHLFLYPKLSTPCMY